MTGEQLNEIVENLEFGLRCFVHKVNHTIIALPDSISLDPDELDAELEMEDDSWAADIKEISENFSDYFEVEKNPPHVSFEIMTEFIDQVHDEGLRKKLIGGLNRPKPFRNFKYIIDNSEYRDDWFAFKKKRQIELLKEQLKENNI